MLNQHCRCYYDIHEPLRICPETGAEVRPENLNCDPQSERVFVGDVGLRSGGNITENRVTSKTLEDSDLGVKRARYILVTCSLTFYVLYISSSTDSLATEIKYIRILSFGNPLTFFHSFPVASIL